MSQTNVEMIERMYEAFYRGDAEGALANFDPGVEVDASMRADVGIVHGREGVRDTVARWVGAWDEWREEIEEIRDLGSRCSCAPRNMVGVREPASKSKPGMRSSMKSMAARSSAWPFTPRPPKHSKPWGYGSRRCRRRM
jgi:hypothetical protein